MYSKTSEQKRQEFSQRGTRAHGIIPATQQLMSALWNMVSR